MDDLTSSNTEAKGTVSENQQECDKIQETEAISGHSNPANDVSVRPSLASNEVGTEILSKRKRKRMLKHEQWLQRKEQKK